MADLSLVFDILAKDKASETLNKVGDQADSTGKKVVKGLGVIGGALAAIGIGAFVSESVASLQRIERINAQTEAVIRSTGGVAGVTAQHIEDYAGALENATASEAESIQSGANLLATFTNVRNAAGQGNDVFDQTVSVATDMARALDQTGEANVDATSSSLLLGKALNDPIRGLSALTRVGVSFTEQQRDQITALVEAGDVMGAQKLILEELNKEFGGAGEAFAASTAGKVELAKHALGTFGETILANTLPALADLASFAADGFNAAAEGFQTGEVSAEGFDGVMQQVGVTIGDVADGVGFLVSVGAGFVDFIGSVPGPVLAGVTAMTAFALLKGPVSSAMETIALKALYARDAVAATAGGIGGVRGAAGGLVGFLGGPWGLAIGAATVGLGFLISGLSGTDEAAEASAGAQRTFADAVRETNGAVDESTRAAAAKAAQDKGLLDIAEDLGLPLARVTDAALGNRDAYNELTSAANAYYDQSLLSENAGDLGMTENAARVDDFIAGLDELAPTVDNVRQEQEALGEATDTTTGAQGAATMAAQTLADTQQQLADDTNAAKQAVDAIRLALDQLGGQTVSSLELESALAQAVQDATGSMTDLTGEVLNASGGLNTQTETGQAAIETLAGIRTAGFDLISNQAQLGESTDVLTGRATSLREQFIAAAGQMGINEEAANALADQYGLIPADVVTTVNANTGVAAANLTALQTQINGLTGKDITIRASTRLSGLDPSGRAGGAGYGQTGGLAAGGAVSGPGTGTSDEAGLFALSNGEHVWTAAEVRAAGGHSAIESMRREVIAKGRGLAEGGPVINIGMPSLTGLTVDAPAEALASLLAVQGVGDSAEPGTGLAAALQWARSQVGKPYIWGSAGPAGFDCSGFMAAITNVARGRSPNSRLGSTATFPWSGFSDGYGAFTIGSTPNAGGGIGHMAGTLLGVNVESRGGQGVVVGGTARGAGDRLFKERAHLATYDTGGLLQPGYTLAYNGTGRSETIRTAEQEKALRARSTRLFGDVYLSAPDRETGYELIDELSHRMAVAEQGGVYSSAGQS